jgi:hypothetical protein
MHRLILLLGIILYLNHATFDYTVFITWMSQLRPSLDAFVCCKLTCWLLIAGRENRIPLNIYRVEVLPIRISCVVSFITDGRIVGERLHSHSILMHYQNQFKKIV